MNTIFVAGIIGSLMGFFLLFRMAYPRMLAWCLDHKLLFLPVPLFLTLIGG